MLAHGAAWLTLALLAGIIVSLVIGAAPAIREYGLAFLWTSEWDPVQNRYGGLVMIYGTLMTSFIALLIAVPVSFGIALFLTELSPRWLKRPLGTAIELLAAVPSIVYGMWGLLVFGPILSPPTCSSRCSALFGGVPVLGALFTGPPVGIGMLSAGIILAIMIIPFIASVMRDVFEVTPPMLKESAYGLGSTTWEVVSKVVLPYTKTGVVGGIMLGLGRALGETMAVTFVIGNLNQLNSLSLFEAGQQHHLGPRQRVRRGRRRPAPGLADLSRPGAVLHHLRRAGAVQAAADAAAAQRRNADERRADRPAPSTPARRPRAAARAGNAASASTSSR